MSRRHMQHPDAVRERIYQESVRPNPWKPTHRYRIVLRTRDGRSERRGTEPTLEAARKAVEEFFDFDVDDKLDGAWISEEVVL